MVLSAVLFPFHISKFLIFDQGLSFKNAGHICVALHCLTAAFTMYIIYHIINRKRSNLDMIITP